MKIKDIKNKPSTYGAFDKFADKLDKIKKQLMFEEEYKKIKDREKRYLERKKNEQLPHSSSTIA
jgi:hypothetical protein